MKCEVSFLASESVRTTNVPVGCRINGLIFVIDSHQTKPMLADMRYADLQSTSYQHATKIRQKGIFPSLKSQKEKEET